MSPLSTYFNDLNMNRIFLVDKLPAMWYILLSSFVFVAGGMVNFVGNSPTLTVERRHSMPTCIGDSAAREEFNFRVTNSTPSVIWRTLKLGCAFDKTILGWQVASEPHKIVKALIIAEPPAAPADTQPVLLANGQRAIFRIPIMLPGNSFLLQITTIQNKVDNEYPLLYVVSCDEPINLGEAGILDWCRGNYLLIGTVLSIILFCLLIRYSFLISRRRIW
jgi:hypothetical protein